MNISTSLSWPVILLSALAQLDNRGVRSYPPYRLYYVEGYITWFSPQLVMGAMKPDTPFTRLLLLCQGLLGRADERRVEFEMRHISISAVAVLFGLRRRRPGW